MSDGEIFQEYEDNEDVAVIDGYSDFTFKNTSPLVFTEINSVNLDYKDHEGDDDGWVELYNSSDSVVSTEGFYLSKNKQNLWPLGNTKIFPKSFMIVFLSGKNIPNKKNPSDTVDLRKFVCTKSECDVNRKIDFLSSNEIVLKTYIKKSSVLDLSLLQQGLDEHLCWKTSVVGTGDDNVYCLSQIPLRG